MLRQLALTVAALATAVTLTACGGDDSTPTDTAASGGATAGPTGTPASGPHNDADVMFATGMIPHHAQAIEMSEIILAADDVDPAVAEVARQIKAAQGPEIEQMRGWLARWGEEVPPATGTDAGGMGGMDHSGDGGMMGGNMGLMSDDDMAALADAQGAEAADLFLEGMVVHHEGAIEMARQELAEGANADAKELAEAIIEAQESEIATMTELLAG